MLLARRGVFGFPARFRVLILCAALMTFLGDEFYSRLCRLSSAGRRESGHRSIDSFSTAQKLC